MCIQRKKKHQGWHKFIVMNSVIKLHNKILFAQVSAYGSLKQSQNLTHKPWKCPQLPGTEIIRLWECKNTEFLLELKHGFLKAAISRTVHLRECPFPLYFYYSSELMCPGPLSLCNSLVSFHPSLCVFCFCYSFCLCFYLCVCLSHCSLPLSCSHYFHSTACT